jgi:hypothetical protein
MLLSTTYSWKSRQVDCTNAFCQEHKPTGTGENQDVVLKLKKSLYGQVNSPRLFREHLQKGMHEHGFGKTKFHHLVSKLQSEQDNSQILPTAVEYVAFSLVVKYELRFELRLRRNFILRVITSNYVRNISHDSFYE